MILTQTHYRWVFALATLSAIVASGAVVFDEITLLSRFFRLSLSIYLLYLILFHILYASITGREKLKRHKSGNNFMLFLFLFSLLCLFSSAYSYNPVVSLGRSFEYFSFVAFAFFFTPTTAHNDCKNLVPNLILFICIQFVFLFLLEVYIAGFGALFVNPESWDPRVARNNFSALAACILLFHLPAAMKYFKVAYVAPLLFVLLLLILSNSRTSIFIFIACTSIFLISSNRFIALFFLIWLTSLISIPQIDELSDWLSRGQSASDFWALSGRLELWGAALEQVMERPVFGWGYYAFEEEISTMVNAYGLRQTTVDNSFISVLVGTGLVGLSLFSAAFLKVLSASLRAIFSSKDVVIQGSGLILIFTLLRTFFNPTFIYLNWNLLLLIFSGLAVSNFRLSR